MTGCTRTASLFALIGLLVGAALQPTGATADAASEARFFDELARRAFARRDYGQALEDFVLAYTAAPSASVAYNAGVCAELADEPQVAFTFFSRYLAANEAHAARRAYAEEALGRLRPQLRIVEVRTEPAGATLFVGDVLRGAVGVAPLSVPLESGEQRLIARAPGHEETELTLPDGASGDVIIRLEPLTGSLDVDVSPEHAEVVVLRGEHTIARATGDAVLTLPVGRYRLRLDAEGHAPGFRRVAITDSPMSVRISATPNPTATALLLVSTSSPGAEVRLDGRAVGRSPLRLPGVAPGPHRIDVRTGHGRWQSDVSLDAGEARHVRARVEP